MLAATLLTSALVRAPTPALKPVVPRIAPPMCAPTPALKPGVSRIAPPMCALDIDQNVLFGVGAAVALGAAAFTQQKDDGAPSPRASVPSQPASSPSSSAAAVPAWAAPQPKSRWPSKGGGGGVHRMAGRVYPPPVRELWYEPVGGTTGPHRMAGRLPPPPKPVIEYTPPTSTFRVTTSKASDFDAFWRTVQGKEKWPSLGGGGGYHRMAGRWPPPGAAAAVVEEAAPAAAAQPAAAPAADAAPRVRKRDRVAQVLTGRSATPSYPSAATAKPAAEPVVSWYDSGVRLSSGEEVAAEAKPAKKTSAGRGATPAYPSAAAAKPAAEPVVSWYDSGKRL